MERNSPSKSAEVAAIGDEVRVVRTPTGNRVHEGAARPAPPVAVAKRAARTPVPVVLTTLGVEPGPTNHQATAPWKVCAILGVLALSALALGFRARANWRDYVATPRAALASERRAPRSVSSATPVVHAATPPRPAARAQVERDDAGQITRVQASNPQAVLRAFCAESAECNPIEALELGQPFSAETGVRIGLFRDRLEPEREWALTIRHDPVARRWAAGDGMGPVALVPAPTLRLAPGRVPVSAG